MRAGRYTCQSCDWIGTEAELLTAPHPFSEGDTITGCPKCKAVEDIVAACDVEGCPRPVSCGWPSPSGYRTTCGQHHQPER